MATRFRLWLKGVARILADPPSRLAFRLIVVAAVLFLLLRLTQTETLTVELHVADGRCTAVLYGRSSTIDCPELARGASLTPKVSYAGSWYVLDPRRAADPRLPMTWRDVRLTDGDGRPLAEGAPLPLAFNVRARLLRPREPAALVLYSPDYFGQVAPAWAFIVDGPNRRGVWWEWEGATWDLHGRPSTALSGIPLEWPTGQQLKPLIGVLLSGGLGSMALVLPLLRILLSQPSGSRPAPIIPGLSQFTARLATFATRHPSLVTRCSVLVAILFAFAVASHVAISVLGRIPHVQDSVTYLFQAQTLARGAVTAPAPPLATAEHTAHFDQEFLLVRDGRWFGKYPPGYPAVLALGVLARAPWLVNPLLAALTVALFYALARRFRQTTDHRPPPPASLNTAPLNTAPPTTDLLAPLLLATSPFFLVMSGSLMAHTTELFWTTLFMLAWITALARRPAHRHPGRAISLVTRHSSHVTPWPLLAGVALGMLFLTRQYTAATIGLSFGAGWLVAQRLAGRRRQTPHDSPQTATRLNTAPLITDLLNTALLLLTALPFLLALLAHQHAVTGNALTDPRLLYWPYDRVGFGPDIGQPENAFDVTQTSAGLAIAWFSDPTQPPHGHSPARGLFNLTRNLEALESHLFGWPPLLTLAFVWLAFLLRRPSAGDWVWLLVALAVAGGYVAYWHAGIAYGPRYLYAALPALVILSARGVAALTATIGRDWAAAILVVLIGYNLWQLPGHVASYRVYNFISGSGQQRVEAAARTPALVFITPKEGDWWEYGAYFSGNTPWLDGPVVYARDLGLAENDRLRAHFPHRTAFRLTLGQLTEY